MSIASLIPLVPSERNRHALEIAFQTRELRDICEKEPNAVDALGMDTAGALKRRLADLRAANSIEDLVVGKPTALHGPGEGRMAISLTENYRLVLSANHRHHPLTEDGDVNWPQVRRVKVERIERLHV